MQAVQVASGFAFKTALPTVHGLAPEERCAHESVTAICRARLYCRFAHCLLQSGTGRSAKAYFPFIFISPQCLASFHSGTAPNQQYCEAFVVEWHHFFVCVHVSGIVERPNKMVEDTVQSKSFIFNFKLTCTFVKIVRNCSFFCPVEANFMIVFNLGALLQVAGH